MWKLIGKYKDENEADVPFEITVKVGRGFTKPTHYDHKQGKVVGIQYPSCWPRLSAEEKVEIGLVEIPDAPKPTIWDMKPLEDRPEFEEDGVTPILDENGDQLITEGLKTLEIKEVKRTCASLVGKFDWMGSRYITDPSKPVPPNIVTYCNAVRTRSDELEVLVLACTTKDELHALTTSKLIGEEIHQAELNIWPKLEKTL